MECHHQLINIKMLLQLMVWMLLGVSSAVRTYEPLPRRKPTDQTLLVFSGDMFRYDYNVCGQVTVICPKPDNFSGKVEWILNGNITRISTENLTIKSAEMELISIKCSVNRTLFIAVWEDKSVSLDITDCPNVALAIVIGIIASVFIILVVYYYLNYHLVKRKPKVFVYNLETDPEDIALCFSKGNMEYSPNMKDPVDTDLNTPLTVR